ncbi:MAG: hypothetical protein LBS32_04115 [Clostridiales Family XIII bacterium]|nr:hypothetical protein [Clostridiales Family XIII bacterium]
MRRRQQTQILETLQSMREAQAAGLYGDCQQAALSVGGFIESVAGEGTRAVALLEEYCELLYRASRGESDKGPLRRKLAQAESSVMDDLAPDRLEIAFLPYKASMADSIESVYLAAKADPACDAYWVPIPYYDRNPDGSLGRAYCEGAGFYGKGIEVTDWREYDIEARRPDAIFTFSPYDGGNLVTSIHPDYYCGRLRGLTDLLVYIPYFVAADESGVQGHFCTLAGCLHAHRVILQSEPVRRFYIEAFKKFEREKGCRGRFGRPEEKFVALGSPKFDKAIGTRREDCEMPDGWRRLIEGPDGARRKAVLYNTSVGAMLQGGEQYLAKLRHVLGAFKGRGDAALWWRPHPLGESTYRAMRPELAEGYRRIVAEYRREGWGIYDDTPDLHRAIAWTDGYYGDMSSVIALYQATGKPVMLANSVVGEDDPFSALSVQDMHCSNAFLWFDCIGFNGLFRMPIDSQVAEFMGFFPDLPLMTRRPIFDGLAESGGKLYFAPSRCHEIGVYDMSSGAFDAIRLPSSYDGVNESLFIGVKCVGGRLVFVPHIYPSLLSYDIGARAFTDHSEVFRLLTPNPRLNIPGMLGTVNFQHALARGTKVFMPYMRSNKVLVFDAATFEYEVRSVGKGDIAFSAIEYDGENFWLPTLTPEGGLYRWNYETDECALFEFPQKIICKYNVAVNNAAMHGGTLYIFSWFDNYVWAFDIASQTFRVDDALQGECDMADNCKAEENYASPVVADGVLYAYALKSGSLVKYDLTSGQFSKENIAAGEPERLEEAVRRCVDECDEIINESVMPLEKLLDCLQARDCDGDAARRGQEPNAGRSIYAFARDAVLEGRHLS